MCRQALPASAHRCHVNSAPRPLAALVSEIFNTSTYFKLLSDKCLLGIISKHLAYRITNKQICKEDQELVLGELKEENETGLNIHWKEMTTTLWCCKIRGEKKPKRHLKKKKYIQRKLYSWKNEMAAQDKPQWKKWSLAYFPNQSIFLRLRCCVIRELILWHYKFLQCWY